MKIVLLLIALKGFPVYAQIISPVHWSYTSKKIDDHKFELHITANLDNGWHLFSQTQPRNAIAQPTEIKFIKNPLVTLSGKAKEIGQKEKYENKELGIGAYQYQHQLEFVQPIFIKGKAKTIIRGTILYQTCTEEQCLPPKTINFSIPII